MIAAADPVEEAAEAPGEFTRIVRIGSHVRHPLLSQTFVSLQAPIFLSIHDLHSFEFKLVKCFGSFSID
jgi:hypothetical protein